MLKKFIVNLWANKNFGWRLARIVVLLCVGLEGYIMSQADEIIPYQLGRRLFDAALAPKQFYEVKNAPHNLTFDIGGAAYYEALRGFINSSCGE